jgi:glycosyltransferase involved in cell wall biosynthesis
MITLRADYGGGPEHVFRLIEALPDSVRVSVACPIDFPYWGRYENLLGKGKLLELPHRKFTIGHLMKLREFVQSENVQIIHSHGKGAGIYSRLLSVLTGIPCIHTYHGIHIGTYKTFTRLLYLNLERMLSRLTRRFIAVSQGEAELVKQLQLCCSDKLNIICNGVVIPPLLPSERLQRKKTVISMSRFDYQKNSQLLIPILSRLRSLGIEREFEFIVLGDGQEREALENDICNLGFGTSVSFAGNVQQPGTYLQRAFCYLSTSRWEGLPLAVLEAMAHGTPVIATDVVGHKDLVQDGINGYLYDIEAPNEAADRLLDLMVDCRLWDNFSFMARKTIVDKYSVTNMAMETAKLYDETVRGITN